MTDDFFEPLPEPRPPEPYEPPVWFQPPEDELAALVPARQVLARTDRGVVLVLSHIDAYREGCSVRIRAIAHRHDAMEDDEWYEVRETTMHGDGSRHHRSRPGLADDLLRFGVQFPDGRKATTTWWPEDPHQLDPQQPDRAPTGPVLVQHGRGGSGADRLATSSWSLWLWPLPPAEPFDLVVAWPALGVDLTRVELPGEDIVEAARRAAPLWTDTPT